jgi:putative oxygen-independent coproporphyrinogen III oxidase
MPVGSGRAANGFQPAEAAPAESAAQVAPGLGTEMVSAPRSLYVHVPFCISVCPYCDFVVVAGAAARGPRSRIPAFLAAVRREIELRADDLDATWGRPDGNPAPADRRRPPLDTLYLGGGTPSLLAPGDVAGLVELVRARFGLATDAEVTIEANPGPDERGDPRALVAAGITRISYGAQALDGELLRALGRRHRPADVGASVASARAAGIASVSLDLLYDVPGQTVAGFAAALEAALRLEPDHLSLYALTLDDPDAEGLTGPAGDHLPTSTGARRWRAAARPRQDEDRGAVMYEAAVERLAAAGFIGYEISNWARPGHESRHNLAYWTRTPHEAVGPGAHAFDGVRRRWNAARLDRYVEALTPARGGPGALPPGGDEELEAPARMAERVILGLRLAAGIPAAWSAWSPLARQLEWSRAAGLLADGPGDRLVLTTRGRLLSNELFARLV